MPSLFRVIVVVGIFGAVGYVALYLLANYVDPKTREMSVTVPPDHFVKRQQWRAMGARTAPAPRLVELFLDMLASERGGATNTLEAYTRDLDDLPPFLGGASGGTVATADHFGPARLSRRPRGARTSSRRRSRAGCPRSASFIASSMPKTTAATIPPRSSKGPKRGRPLPKVLAVGEVDRLIAAARRRRSRRRAARPAARRSGSTACSNCSTRPACAFPSWWRCRLPRRGATSAC